MDDADDDMLNASWYSNLSGSWALFATNSSIDTSSGGVNISQTFTNATMYNTTYYWSVNLTDGVDWCNETYHFTTEADPWWDSDWSYYKTLEVADKIDDYQMKIIIDYDTDYGGNVSCEGHCQADFDDIRFVYNNATELPYWLENYTSGIQATIWINNSGNYSSFEMFYGNSGVGTTSNGTNTFLAWDDFDEGYSVGDTPKAGRGWTTSAIDASNYLKIAANPSGSGNVLKRTLAWDDLTARLEMKNFAPAQEVRIFFKFYGTTSTNLWLFTRTFEDVLFPMTQATYSHNGNQDVKWYLAGVDYTEFNPELDASTSVWMQIEERVYKDDYHLILDGTDGDGGLLRAMTNGIYSWDSFGTGIRVVVHYLKDFFICKYTTGVEPSWSGFSSEQSAPTNNAPTITGEIPANSSTSISRWAACNVTCNDQDGDSLTVYFYENTTGSWVLQQTNSSHTANTSAVWGNYTNASAYNTTYWWSVNVTDGGLWTNETYHFTTAVNQTPVFSDATPSNGSTSVSTSTSTLTITINDPEGDMFNWSIETSPDIGNAFSNNATNGSKTCSISGLGASTTYRWYVNATDTASKNWTREWYTFTTASPSGGGNGGSGWTPRPPPKKITTSEDTMEDIEQLYGVTLDDPFYATDTNGDDIVDSFTDPNGVLTNINSVDINGNVSFLLSIDDDTIPEFFWDVDTDTATTISYTLGTVTGTYIDPVEETVTFVTNVDKGDWIYIEAIDQYLPDEFPNYNLIVKTSDNRIISSDMIWRENGKIFVLDDPDVQYVFVYGYDILPASFEPPNGTTFNITMPTIIIAYQEQVQIISAIFGPLNITKQITSSGNEIFTYTLTTRLPSGTYTLSVTVQDADNNSRTDKVTYIINIAEEQPVREIPWLTIAAVGIIIALAAIIIFLRKKKIF